MTDLIKEYVDAGRFTDLFVEGLGWDRPHGKPRALSVATDSGVLTVDEVATYRGITVWQCGEIPDGRGQRLVDREARNASDERLVIFHDGQRQEWRWPQAKDTQGTGATRLVLHEHVVGRENPALAQRLAQIELGLGEEGISVVEVGRRLRRAFDAEKVTNRFYKRFKLQHEALCEAITGLEDAGEDAMTSEVRWYGSLLLNRIMFIYFMQKKGFLDEDQDYLRNRLVRIRAMERSDAPGTFYDFYKHFLLPLFHHGLGHPERASAIDDPAIAALIGDIPYVNGGIFSVHPLEAANDIAVPDAVFESMFDFLDGWQWHLDDRLTGDPNEINPDVLGYIFEQFINNKQQGAYYTKEDVTAYMTDNALVPVVLDRLADATGINPWLQLAKNPQRYIWPSVSYGTECDLPREIEVEMDCWPRPAWESSQPPSHLGLPGESWWEVVQRREYFSDLRKRLALGTINTSDEAVSANIDLVSLAVDAIDGIDSSRDVIAAWDILTRLKVIDPTCGSGAFLFAALTTLETLYSATLDAARLHARLTSDEVLTALVNNAEKHSSTSYFLLKHAALSNIYGVDLMPEGVEIARLRLFLKLMSQAQRKEDIEPLPDLEFNIRPGNILVGAVDDLSIERVANLESLNQVGDVLERVAEAAATYRAFADAQASGNASTADVFRTELRRLSSASKSTLDEWWFNRDSRHAGIDDLERYLDIHRPFHWPIEFPEVFMLGGFDVVIGNPPYVNKSTINYRYSGFETDDVNDIYAPCLERAADICRTDGRLSMVVLLSLQFSSRFGSLRAAMRSRFAVIHCSSFDLRPSSLFTGVMARHSIVIGRRQPRGQLSRVFTTHPVRWIGANRPHIFATLQYSDISELIPEAKDTWIKTGDTEVRDLLLGLIDTPGVFGEAFLGGTGRVGFRKTSFYFVSAFTDDPPAYDANLNPISQTQIGEIRVQGGDEAICVAILIGKLFSVWWSSTADLFHVNRGTIDSFPVSLLRLPKGGDAVRRDFARGALADLLQNPTYTFYDNKWLGGYDVRRAHRFTDGLESSVLLNLGLERFLPAVFRAHARLQKASGSAGNVLTTWPPPE